MLSLGLLERIYFKMLQVLNIPNKVSTAVFVFFSVIIEFYSLYRFSSQARKLIIILFKRPRICLFY